MWHNHQRGPFTRGGRFNTQSRLTQLYNDTKLSYENAKNSTTNPQFDDDPQVINLKKAFQVQQDRLLAWGMHWADKQAGGSRSSKGGHDVNIDEKVDQAGLGDIVATIMENIKNLLAESGRLQHPGRWNESLHTRGRGGFRSMSSEKFGLPVSGKQQEEWKEFEITTGRTLLDKLSSNIDLLYELGQAEQSSSEDVGSTKWEQDRKWQEEQPQPWIQETGVVADKLVMEPEVLKSMSVSDLFEPAGANASQKQAVAALQNHGLYVDFTRLEAMHDPNAVSDLPSYEDSKANPVTLQGRSVYFFRQIGMHVLVDLVKASDSSLLHMATTQDDPIKQMHELANKISGKGLLTWDGHLKLIGFTLVDANTQFGFVYALPAPSDPTALQSCQTLTNSIAATFEHEQSMPPLENKIKLAYNLALTSVGYLAQNECHGHIRPSNVVFFRENDNPRLGQTLRCPYLLQPIQNVAGATEVNASASFYHHPQADVIGYGITPAYDVYSVGLLLLEIGLWRPLSTFWKAKYDKDVFHERLRKLYVPKLASKCGTRYSKIVESCLSAPEELQERPTPVDAAEYLLHLVEALAQCCGIDEEGPPSELDIDVFEALIEQQRINGPLPAKGPLLPPRTQSAPTLTNPPSLTKQASVSSKVKQKPAEALKKWPDLDIPQDHLETWNKMLMPRLSKMLQGVMKDAQESCSVSLMMIGTTPEKAKTTICVQCKDTARVREKLCAKFKPKSGWGLVICPGDVRRSGQVRSKKHRPNARRSGASAVDEGEKPVERPREQRFQKFPSCGASIGAFKDDQHLPPVSYGGTILIAGQPYGMTVHHMLEDNDEDEDEYDDADPSAQMRSIAPLTPAGLSLVSTEQSLLNSEENIAAALDDLELYDDSTDEVDSDDESDASTIRPDYAIMDGEGNEFFIMGDDDDDESIPDLDDDDEFSDEDEDDTGSVGDKPGYEAGRYDDEDCCVTQPSIDDFADDYWPDMEDRDSDHLLSHSFGLVYASSGLKRTTKNNIKHEIDWALIKINDDRMNPLCVPEDVARATEKRKGSSSSKLRSSSRHLAKEPTLTGVTPVDALGKLRVTSIGRTSGRKNGRISQAMSLLKLPGRTSFSWSYSVEGGAGVRGDSGAWLYSDERKELCGHIVGWSNALSCGYLVPMEIMFDDLKQTLDCEDIILPGMRTPAIPAEQTRLISRKAVPDSAANRDKANQNFEFRNPTTSTPTEPSASVPYVTSRASRLPAAFSSTNCPPNRKGTQERWEDTIRTLRLDTQQSQQERQKDDAQEDNSPSSASGRRSAAPRRQGGRSKDIYDVVRKGSASFPSSINPIPS